MRPKSTVTSSPELIRRVADEPTTPIDSGRRATLPSLVVPGPRGPYVMRSLYVQAARLEGPCAETFSLGRRRVGHRQDQVRVRVWVGKYIIVR